MRWKLLIFGIIAGCSYFLIKRIHSMGVLDVIAGIIIILGIFITFRIIGVAKGEAI
jgi:hypothetical protein